MKKICGCKYHKGGLSNRNEVLAHLVEEPEEKRVGVVTEIVDGDVTETVYDYQNKLSDTLQPLLPYKQDPPGSLVVERVPDNQKQILTRQVKLSAMGHSDTKAT